MASDTLSSTPASPAAAGGPSTNSTTPSRRTARNANNSNNQQQQQQQASVAAASNFSSSLTVRIFKMLLVSLAIHYLMQSEQLQKKLPEPLRSKYEQFVTFLSSTLNLNQPKSGSTGNGNRRDPHYEGDGNQGKSTAFNSLMNSMKIWLKSVISAISSSSSIVNAGSKFSSDKGTDADFDNLPRIRNDEELDKALENHDRIFLMAYAPWCGHCKAMKPAYVDFAKAINDKYESSKIRVYTYNAVDESANSKILSLQSVIKGFPTLLMVYQKRINEQYPGDRSAKSMEAFVDESFLPLEVSNDIEKLEKHLKSNSIGIINYFPQNVTNHSPKMTVEDASQKTFGISRKSLIFTTDPAVLRKLMGKSGEKDLDESKQQVLVFKFMTYKGKFPESMSDASSSSEEQVDPSVMAYMIVNESSGKFSDKQFMMGKLPPIFIITRLGAKSALSNLTNEDLFDKNDAAKLLKKVVNSETLLGKTVLLHLDPLSSEDSKIASIVGLSQSPVDCFIVFDTLRNQRFGYCGPEQNLEAGGVSHKDLIEFIHNALQGNLTQSVNINLLKSAASHNKNAKSAHDVVALSKHDLEAYINRFPNLLIYTYTAPKHGLDDVQKFSKLAYADNYRLAFIDLTLDQNVKVGDKDIKLENSPEVILFSNGKYVDEFKGEISKESIDAFVEKHNIKPLDSASKDVHKSSPNTTKDL